MKNDYSTVYSNKNIHVIVIKTESLLKLLECAKVFGNQKLGAGIIVMVWDGEYEER